METTLKRKLLTVMLAIAVAFVLLAATETHSSAASGKYWIKINKNKCCATVYKKSGGKWKPYRAMVCAVGKKSTPTPSGTFYLGSKFRWIRMVTDGNTTFEQYTTRFYGEYYIHSPCYSEPSKNKENAHTFYTLGTHATHGCVRFCVMDAKWIYENCPSGTKVTVYSSSKSGPLGKPKKIKYVKKHGRAWDPTDPDPKNPVFKMRKPQFTINKAKKVKYGKKYSLTKGVKVMNTNAIQDLTSKMKVTKLTRNGKTIKLKNFSTKKLGKYKVTYYVKDKYCIKSGGKGTSKTFTFQVIDKSSITGTANKKADVNDTLNLLKGVKAKSLSKNLTSSIKVSVKLPDGTTRNLSAEDAKAYLIEQSGTYKVTYTVTNPYPKKKVTKTISITVAAPEPETPETPDQPSTPEQPENPGGSTEPVAPETQTR